MVFEPSRLFGLYNFGIIAGLRLSLQDTALHFVTTSHSLSCHCIACCNLANISVLKPKIATQVLAAAEAAGCRLK